MSRRKGKCGSSSIPVREVRLSDLRKQDRTCHTRMVLYSIDAEGNIAYGRQAFNIEEVEKFAKYSAASDFCPKRAGKDMIQWWESVA